LQLKNGATTEPDTIRTFTQPIQFLSKDRKTPEWAENNLDWWEHMGIRQIRQNGRRLLKNIRLSKGIIERSDYIPDEENEYSDIIRELQDKEDSVIELKFFPIIPNVINILKAEFAARVSKIMFVGKDDTSYNEMLEAKRQMIEDSLLQQAAEKMTQQLIQSGMDPESDEFKQSMDPQKIRTLPQIEQFFKKDYQSMIAEWATHQKAADEKRFAMGELEVNGFESSLTCDREFWHFKMMENDYQLELWDPVFTYYSKSPNVEYMSNGNVVGKIDFMSPADIIDSYGYLMNEDQLQSLELVAGIRKTENYTMQGVANDGSMYDSTKSYKWNREGPSLGMRQFTSFMDDFVSDSSGIDELFNTSDHGDFCRRSCLRVSTTYWKSQRRLFHLTKISDQGEFIQKVVDEDYKVTSKPMYNTVLFTQKDAESLISGEHLEPIWINETWGGVKIGRGRSTGSQLNDFNFNPIYLGIDAKTPSRLKFQFKGENSLYGCKLPVEGRIFSGKNVKSICLVDLMKPSQINFNIVNNQISDILIDEIGPVGMIDQNALPKHSLGEEWGPGNYAKAYQAMKQYKMLPLDTSVKNMEGTTNFNQYGMLNFDETNRLVSRINLAAHFKSQAMEVVGITPQRVGQVQASESATGTQTATNNSYTQTEMYFVQHSDWLMPRVHEMRTDLAQYYHSKKPSLRLQYITSLDERINFEMNTTGMLSREVGVYCTTQVNSRKILDQLKQFFISNNTTGASLYDLGSALKAESIAEMDRILKTAEEKQQAQEQAKQDHEKEMNDAQIAAAQKEKEDQRAWDEQDHDQNRIRDIQVAEIRSAGMPATDVNKDGQDDYLQRLQYIQSNDQFSQKLQLEREKEINKTNKDGQDNNMKRQEMQTKKEIADKNLSIARENQTRSELIAKHKIKANQK
jgi:hypothetical protein